MVGKVVQASLRGTDKKRVNGELEEGAVTVARDNGGDDVPGVCKDVHVRRFSIASLSKVAPQCFYPTL